MLLENKDVVVVGLGFGDEGKGATIDYLATTLPESEKPGTPGVIVVKYTGGPQAAHNVCRPDGRHHTFSQYGSHVLTERRELLTILSRNVLVNPLNLRNEQIALHSKIPRSPIVLVPGTSVVITPVQRAANQLREIARGKGRHGSCGQGVGETRDDLMASRDNVLTMNDLCVDKVNRHVSRWYRDMVDRKREQLASIWDDLPNTQQVHDAKAVFTPAYQAGSLEALINVANYIGLIDQREDLWPLSPLIYEGAQGVLLDEDYGFHPYTTWSKTTSFNALAHHARQQDRGRTRGLVKLGIIRAYGTRHGPGPFVTETPFDSRFPKELHNGYGQFQGGWRVGFFDLVALKYALAVEGGVDGLVVNHMDALDRLAKEYAGKIPVATDYFGSIPMSQGPDLEDKTSLTHALQRAKPIISLWQKDKFLEKIEERTNTPVVLTANGPTWEHRTPRWGLG